jgi:VIT1/CCC1 family predicted Fe2+/Mn2+ transporter
VADSQAGDPRAESYVVVNTPSGPIVVPHSAMPPTDPWGRYPDPAAGTAPMPIQPPRTAPPPAAPPPAAPPTPATADAAWDDPRWDEPGWGADDWGADDWGADGSGGLAWGNGVRGRGRRGAPASSGDRFRGYLAAERESAAMYRELAGVSDGPQGEVLRQLADVEDDHAGHWEDQLRTMGESVPAAFRHRRSLRLRIVIWLARWFSLSAVLPLLEASERASAGRYDDESAADPDMPIEERRHARLLAGMSVRQASRGGIGAGERWHRHDRSGALRAAVFGVNDGLVSNASLVLGFVGSGASNRAILLAGVAGLLAGAFSMGAGEFVSVSSQREIFAAEIRLEEEELRHFPQGEERELALLYQVKGLPKEQAEQTARKIMENPATALDTLAREELGLDPAELGSPWATAASSAASFTAGAFVVVLPFLIGSGTAAAVAAVLLAAIALAVVGGGLSLLTGNSPRRGATRQLLVGGLAAAAAFAIGGLLGVGVT